MTLTQAKLQSLLHYEPATGLFTWLVVSKKGSVKVGDVAGCRRSPGNSYVVIRVERRLYAAHRLAWFYVHGVWPPYIDHRNNLKDDNRLDNLREATKAQNAHNCGPRPNRNKSGFKGVNIASRAHRRSKKWVAGICTNGKRRHLGYFASREEAAAAYAAAAAIEHGEFARSA